jgi:hypothetical protein
MPTVTITQEAHDLVIQYGKNVSQGIIAMGEELCKKTEEEFKSKPVDCITKDEFRKEMEKLKEGIRNTNAEFMAYLSSGQGAIKVSEFRRASLREEK